MGEIKKQSIRGTLYSYIGAFLGFLITGFMLPQILTAEENGLRGLLMAVSVIMAHVANIGLANVITMFFPYFRNPEKKHNGFLILILKYSSAGFIFSMIVYFVLRPWLISSNLEDSALFADYIDVLIPLTFILQLFNILDAYIKVLYNATIGISLKEIWQRIYMIIGIALYYYGYIDFNGFIIAFILSNFLPLLMLIVKLMISGNLSLTASPGFADAAMRKKMFSVGIYALITTLGSSLILYIDQLMVNAMIDIRAAGIYIITYFFGSIVIIPSRSVIKISSIMLADAWKDQDLETVYKIYYKSVINQLLIGSFIFIGIWSNIDNIMDFILPAKYAEGRYVIFFIGIGFMFEMASGVSSALLATSKYYKATTTLQIFLIGIVVLLNYLLIPVYGIIGAAISTVLSKFLYNFIRFVYLNRTFKMQPYNYRSLLIILIAVISWFVAWILPFAGNHFLDMFLRTSVMTICFGTLAISLKVSEEVNIIYHKVIILVKQKVLKNK
ncbi:MAG: hypothetical protein A2W91_13535 [Bacteroidetes bacterium GWF2_38_335]|nr:MAG: hypothetical protein A2W91_13535 [Bacteroidetes bacterium GWF2_38_335]OFY77274.1 MAG: hypothetical protein A2281_15200 [Bacteroidetes bacterium RIFOXYA12_FULL_38_20]HBS85722.1 hypothetical protein [Bacteroidales bacterium]